MFNVGNWNVYTRTRKNRNKSITKYHTNNIILVEYLYNLDYDKKSIASPTKILEKLSDDLKVYFFRGISDGDGCFYIGDKQYQYVLSSSIEQDWTYFEILLTNLGCKYKKDKVYSEKGNSSYIRISNKKDVCKFGDYLYTNNDKIFLERKYDKYLLIKEKL